MKNRAPLNWLKRYSSRQLLTIFLAVVLLSGALPQAQSQTQQPSAINKLSVAVQQALGNNNLLVWSDPSSQTLRVLIQSYNTVSPDLIAAILASGGLVVRQFTSINGVLAQ